MNEPQIVHLFVFFHGRSGDGLATQRKEAFARVGYVSGGSNVKRTETYLEGMERWNARHAVSYSELPLESVRKKDLPCLRSLADPP